MSTFNGFISEFPHIRIDFFRKNPTLPAPLACFLSHVHSDHLSGLESLRAPFIYCSSATRELLLRIEKYPHRMNFSKGILEARRQHYRHLANLLKPIPLETPTEIELDPQNRMRVTLFNANHCPGAVMFLIEGDGKAILYTGDIRAEAWWVSTLARNPVLIPYVSGLKRLDRVYLDTTFATKSDIYRSFPSKADGLRELLTSVQDYPENTVFYFRSWTLGYEDVWIALSSCLGSKVHVDKYQRGLYGSLNASPAGFGMHEGPSLNGFKFGNRYQTGVLTDDQTVRVHSCEPGTERGKETVEHVVWILPIVTRDADGTFVPEVGAGGGGRDLYQTHELELVDEATLKSLAELCVKQIKDASKLTKVLSALTGAFKSSSKSLSLDDIGLRGDETEASIQQLISQLAEGADAAHNKAEFFMSTDNLPGIPRQLSSDNLPKVIRFPYSRHSSYSELCGLIEILKPRDIYPCTVNMETWGNSVSMETLFGHLCSSRIFSHDAKMLDYVKERDRTLSRKRPRRDSGASTSTASSDYQQETTGVSTSKAPLAPQATDVLKFAASQTTRRSALQAAFDSLTKQPQGQATMGSRQPTRNLDGSASQTPHSQDTRSHNTQAKPDIPPPTQSKEHIDSMDASATTGDLTFPNSQTTLSSSAFDSQSQAHIPFSDEDDNEVPEEQEEIPLQPNSTVQQQHGDRIRNRKDAYKAARRLGEDGAGDDDNGEGWAAHHALLSAGNTHDEEDEL